jgi:hypothetical protein
MVVSASYATARQAAVPSRSIVIDFCRKNIPIAGSVYSLLGDLMCTGVDEWVVSAVQTAPTNANCVFRKFCTLGHAGIHSG